MRLRALHVVWFGGVLALIAFFLIIGPCQPDIFRGGGESGPGTSTPETPVTRTGTPAAATSTPTASAVSVTPVTTPITAPTATLTPLPTNTPVPAITVRSADPVVGTTIDRAQVDVVVDVEYAPSPADRRLSWSLTYCASPSECTEEPLPDVTLTTGTARVTLRHTWPASGDARPVVVCQYRVTIAGGGNAEARWESARATDPRCDESQAAPSIRITTVSPDVGQPIAADSVVGVTVTFVTGPGERVIARYYADGCGSREAYGELRLERVGAGSGTVAVLSSAQSSGTVHHIDAWLMDGERVIAYDKRGPC